MNTTSTVVVVHDDERDLVESVRAAARDAERRRTTWLDRVALRVGVWLILRRATTRRPAHADVALRRANELARAEREAQWQSSRLLVPWR